jgi:hypothetical protein
MNRKFMLGRARSRRDSQEGEPVYSFVG